MRVGRPPRLHVAGEGDWQEDTQWQADAVADPRDFTSRVKEIHCPQFSKAAPQPNGRNPPLTTQPTPRQHQIAMSFSLI